MTKTYEESSRQIPFILSGETITNLKALKEHFKHRSQSDTVAMLINEKVEGMK